MMKQLFVVLAMATVLSTSAFAQDCTWPGTEEIAPYPGLGPVYMNNPELEGVAIYTCTRLGLDCYYGELGTTCLDNEECMDAYDAWVPVLQEWTDCCIADIQEDGRLDSVSKSKLVRLLRIMAIVRLLKGN